MKNNLYKIINSEASNAELKKYQECFYKNGTERDLANLQWLHQQNTVYTNLIYYALTNDNDSIASIYTALPAFATVEQRPVKAIQSIDTLTDKDHRGKGLFIMLAKKLYDDAAEKGFAFVYGFPNENSAPGFFKKLGWTSFGEVPFLIKPVRISYFLKKVFRSRSTSVYVPADFKKEIIYLKNHITIKPISNFKNDYDKLWQAVAKQIKVGVQRDVTYMNWRFINKPGGNYDKYGIYHNEELEAVIVFTLKNKHDGLVGYIMEFIFYPGKIESAKKLLQFANRYLKRNKADVILTWCIPQSFNYKTYKSCGYFRFPERLRPQKLYFGVKSFNTKFSEILSNLANWYISYADSDTV